MFGHVSSSKRLHVSFPGSPTCLSLGDPRVASVFCPRVVCLLVHVSLQSCCTRRFMVVRRVVFLELRVSVSGCSMHLFHTVARVTYVTELFRHKVIPSQNNK